MNDQKLKIRIQLAQQPQPIDELYPETEKKDEPDKPPFDREKILLALLALLLTGFVVGLISYFIFYWNDKQPPLAEIGSVITTHANSTPSIDMPLNKPTIVEADKKTIDLSLSVHETLVDPTPIEIPKENDVILESDATETTKSAEKLDESNLTPANSLISNTLEDKPQVIRAQLTSAIHQREPVDIIDHVWLDQDTTGQIFFFVQLHDLMGQRVSIHWHYQDKVIAKVPLMIGSQNWRTYASKLLNKTRLGAWHVTLHDQSGKLLSQRSFTVGDRL